MKCEKAQQSIVLVTYGELPDEQMAALEEHLAGCEACSRELQAQLALHEALASNPVVDPSPNLLASARMIWTRRWTRFLRVAYWPACGAISSPGWATCRALRR